MTVFRIFALFTLFSTVVAVLKYNRDSSPLQKVDLRHIAQCMNCTKDGDVFLLFPTKYFGTYEPACRSEKLLLALQFGIIYHYVVSPMDCMWSFIPRFYNEFNLDIYRDPSTMALQEYFLDEVMKPTQMTLYYHTLIWYGNAPRFSNGTLRDGGFKEN